MIALLLSFFQRPSTLSLDLLRLREEARAALERK